MVQSNHKFIQLPTMNRIQKEGISHWREKCCIRWTQSFVWIAQFLLNVWNWNLISIWPTVTRNLQCETDNIFLSVGDVKNAIFEISYAINNSKWCLSVILSMNFLQQKRIIHHHNTFRIGWYNFPLWNWTKGIQNLPKWFIFPMCKQDH